MKRKSKERRLCIETEDTVFEIEFGQIQIEITGLCNMKCQHCRAAYQTKRDMPLDQIAKIIRFARQFRSVDRGELVLSGGEPLMHSEFARVLKTIRVIGETNVSLTTNGSFLNEDHLKLIRDLSFAYFAVSVSLDSAKPDIHDKFRGYKGAFAKADRALRLVMSCGIPGVVACLRSTIQPSQIDEMESLVQYARSVGCRRIGFSAVQPAGKATQRQDLLMTRDQKRAFLTRVYQLRESYSDIDITTTDPLKCLVCASDTTCGDDEIVFDGCGAAVTTFNVDADGTMTPCALLNVPMMNVFPLSVEEITENYSESLIVRNMVMRNLKGECGKCQMKYRCGGCRARAFNHKDDYLGSDPHCWLGF